MSDLRINQIYPQSGVAGSAGVKPGGDVSGVGGALVTPIIEETGLADFNQRAGVHSQRGRPAERLALQQRRLALAPRPAAGTSGAADATGVDDDHLDTAAASAVRALQKGDKSALQDHLENTYDALERHTLLRSARDLADRGDLSSAEKEDIRNSLNDMMADLMDNHGDVVRSGLKNAASFGAAIETMDGLSQANNDLHDPDSVRDLRTKFGAKGDARADAPLTPFELAASLQAKFGVDNFSAALGDLRSKMAAEFRANPASAPGPRLWLSLSDAAAFNAVQSTFSIAGDLRRSLSERLGVTPALHQAGTSLALLNAAQSGAASSEVLLARVIGEQDIGSLSKAHMYMLLRHAVNQMPTGIWSLELMPQRLALLDHLRGLAVETTAQVMSDHPEEADIAQRLRQRVARRNKRDQQGSDSRGQERDDDADENDGPASATEA